MRSLVERRDHIRILSVRAELLKLLAADRNQMMNVLRLSLGISVLVSHSLPLYGV